MLLKDVNAITQTVTEAKVLPVSVAEKQKFLEKLLNKAFKGKTVKAFGSDSKGAWGSSDKERNFKVVAVNVVYVDDDAKSHFASVDFVLDRYSSETDGLIYTDKKFLDSLKRLATSASLDPNAFMYSEQGLQGTDTVNMDVSTKKMLGSLTESRDFSDDNFTATINGKHYKVEVEDVGDEEVNKRWVTVTLPDGKRVSPDWSPYSLFGKKDLELWLKLGMPKREDVPTNGAFKSDSLIAFAKKKGVLA